MSLGKYSDSFFEMARKDFPSIFLLGKKSERALVDKKKFHKEILALKDLVC